MSAPTARGQRGGSSFRGLRGSAHATQSFRGSARGSTTNAARARRRGGEGLLQKLREGTVPKGADHGATQGGRGRGATRASTTSTPRGRGHLTKTFNAQPRPSSAPQSRSASPAPSSIRDFMNDATTRFQSLKQQRDVERAKAIKDGFLADPEKKTTLDKAITPVGTCTEMCPEFERVERMVQNMVDKSEKVKNEDSGRDMPSEAIMVKRFRRSAAGYDEQLPSDIRTPQTLKHTMDYLVDTLIGGPERLAVVHKFVWDRTRAIRNDFSIQQVSKEEDVQMAVECYERIARFHVMSMHQLCNPDNLREGENFDFFQEREQLNNTLLSLMYYYDDNRDAMDFPNEPEFRAYCIIFEIQSQQPDLEDRVQSWASDLLSDNRVDIALKLYRAAGNTLFEQGPLRPLAPYSLAQNNSGSFWTVLASSAVPYLMACVAEIYFAYVRFAALDALWKSGKSAPQAHQAKSQDWNLEALTEYLGFDDESQAVEFCHAFNLEFSERDGGDAFLDFSSYATSSLDKSKIPSRQKFSHTFVEDKRCRRTFVAIIDGLTISQAVREGLVEEENSEEDQNMQTEEVQDDGQSFFIPETGNASTAPSQNTPTLGLGFNPEAPAFTMSKNFGENAYSPISKLFGEKSGPSTSAKFGESTPSFSMNHGNSTGWSGSKPTFAQPAASNASETTNASQPALTSTPFLPSAATQTPSQDSGSGSSSAFELDRKSPFAVSPAPTTTSSEQATSGFSGFDFAKPKPPPASTSPIPSSAFQFNKPTEPASVQPSANQPLNPTNFQFGLSTSALSSQTAQASLPTFTTSTQYQEPEKPAVFLFAPPSQNPASVESSELATQLTQQRPAVFGTVEQKPSFQQPPDSAASKPLFSFENAMKYQPPESPISPRRTSLQQIVPPQPLIQAAQAPEAAKPPIPAFNFISTQAKPTEGARAQTQTGPPPSTTSSVPSFSGLAQVTNPPITQSTTPPTSPRQQADFDGSASSDKSQLIHYLTTLSLCQKGGLLEEYLEYSLPRMLKRVVMEHNSWVHSETIERVKKTYLIRKYGRLWRYRAWVNSKNREAKERRRRFTNLLNKEAEKRKRLEQERLEIVKAVEEKKKLQVEMAEQKKAEELEVGEKAEFQAAMEMMPKEELGTKKRKGLHHDSVKETSIAPTPAGSYRHHKRSRTVGSPMPPPPKPPQSSPRTASNGFRFSNTSLGASVSRSSRIRDPLRRPSHQSPQDTTKTDFFRLLAHGIDPETSWIPLTASQVTAKKKKERQELDARIDAAYNRRKVGTSIKETKSPSAASESPVAVLPSPSPAPSTSGSTRSETDELIEQMREARKQMAEDEQWFREERQRMAIDLEQHEKLRSSASSNQIGKFSVNGLPMINGYEYYPAPDLPSGLMSRVEQRIRATGARGFANRPFGDTTPGYAAVPMSKKSARKNAQAKEEVKELEKNGTAKKRRKHRNVDRNYHPAGEDELSEEEEELEHLQPKRLKGVKHMWPAPHHQAGDRTYKALDEDEMTEEEQELEQLVHKRSKPKQHVQPAPRSSAPASQVKATNNPFDLLQDTDPENEDEQLLEEEQEDLRHLFYHNGEDGDTEELDGEEGLLEDSDEEGDYNHEYEEPESGYLRATSRPSEDAPTPNTQVSNVSSGVGATADDPLELSD